MKRRIGLSVLVFGALLSGCSATTTASSTSTSAPGSLNATPCNYARAWHDNPSQFSEFGTLGKFSRMADSAKLRAEGRRLASAIAADDTGTVSEVTAAIYSTCQQLGLVGSNGATSTTG